MFTNLPAIFQMSCYIDMAFVEMEYDFWYILWNPCLHITVNFIFWWFHFLKIENYLPCLTVIIMLYDKLMKINSITVILHQWQSGQAPDVMYFRKYIHLCWIIFVFWNLHLGIYMSGCMHKRFERREITFNDRCKRKRS